MVDSYKLVIKPYSCNKNKILLADNLYWSLDFCYSLKNYFFMGFGDYNNTNTGFADLTPFFTLGPWIFIFA
jgi:hypothetical protein